VLKAERDSALNIFVLPTQRNNIKDSVMSAPKITITSLKNQKEFDQVNRRGKKFVGRFFIIVMAHNYIPYRISENNPIINIYLGMKVGKKLGNAVIRNKLKRRIRAITRDIYKKNIDTLTNSALIVIPKSQAITQKYAALAQDFSQLCTIHR
jgi:ribonuclease P protein component